MIENKNCVSIFIYAILINYVLNIVKPEAIMNIITIFLILIFTSLCTKVFRNREISSKNFKLPAISSESIE